MNPIAIKIKESRLKAGMSEKDLAKKCSVAPSYIIQIESGKKIINEKTAETILAVFGEKVGFDFQDNGNEDEITERKIEQKKPAVQPDFYDVEPNAQWAGALANIIKKYPIYEMGTTKIAGYKELPILGKKVEGLPWDKLSFIKCTTQELEALRICKNDVLMVHQMKDVLGKGVYLIEMDQKVLLRVVHKDTSNKLILSKGVKEEQGVPVEISKLKILGKVIRVEFML